MSENNIDNNKNNDSGDRKHDEEDQMIEQPTPLPVLKAEDAHVEHHEEKSKYQEELEKNKKKSSFFNKKKSVEIKATSKVTRSDVLSKLEEADLKDQNNPHNQKYMPFDGFKGPASKRKRTDCLCLLIFIILNIGLFINAVLVFTQGSSNRLMNGTDFRAEICGVDQRSDLPYLYYLQPTVDTNVAMCVSKCPDSTGADICLYKKDGVSLTPYCYTQIQTKTRGKYCIPTEPQNKAAIEAELEKVDLFIKRIAGDLGQSADIICLGCFLSVILAYLFQEILKSEKYIKFVIWGCIWGTVFSIAFLAVMCFIEYKRVILFSCLFGIDKHDCGGLKAQGFYYSFIALLCLIGVYLFIVMKLFNSINLAIGIIKASGKATRVLEQMKKIPLIMVIIALVFGVFLLTLIIMAFSVGSIKTIPAKNIDGGQVKIIEYDNFYRLLLVGDFFMLIYWLLFIIGYSDLVTSYSLCIWFFTKKKDTVLLPVQRALKDTLFYHLGTILIVTLFTPLFAIPQYLIEKIKSKFKKSNQKSALIKFLISSMVCCFYLFDKFIRFYSYQSYIQVAMWSLPHGKASQKSYFLINRHKDDLRDIDFLQRFVIFQTKVCCSLLSCIFVYTFISFSSKGLINNDLSSVETPFGPAIFVLFIAFFFSTIFQGSFDIISKTLLQCHLMDSEMFIGDQRYIEPFLKDFFQYFGLKGETRRIQIEAERPKYQIGVTVQPFPLEKEPVKGDIDIEDLSEEESESSNEEEEESEQSIDLMPTKKPLSTKGESRPGTGQSGVEAFKGKKGEITGNKDIFLDNNRDLKKNGIEFDPFNYDNRPVSNSNRPASNSNRPNSKSNRPMSNNSNMTNSINNSIRNQNDGSLNNNSRPISKDSNKIQNNLPYNMSAFYNNNNNNTNNNPSIVINANDQNNIRPNSKGPDIFQNNTLKIQGQPGPVSLQAITSKKNLNEKDWSFVDINQNKNNSKNDSRPQSKELFMKNQEPNESYNLFNKSRMNDDTIKFENFEESFNMNSSKKNANNNYRLN